jgi:ABC-type multidrug transport system ATPase subunit
MFCCSTKGVKGSIKYNGADLGSKTEKKETCYIMQEDRLAPLFTVYEIMTISANLKLGPSLSEKAKQLLVSI